MKNRLLKKSSKLTYIDNQIHICNRHHQQQVARRLISDAKYKYDVMFFIKTVMMTKTTTITINHIDFLCDYCETKNGNSKKNKFR